MGKRYEETVRLRYYIPSRRTMHGGHDADRRVPEGGYPRPRSLSERNFLLLTFFVIP